MASAAAAAGPRVETGNASGARLSRYRLGPTYVHGLEGHAAPLDIGRDRVDDGVGPGKSGGNRGWVAHIGPKR
jgi:hypothetical protein